MLLLLLLPQEPNSVEHRLRVPRRSLQTSPEGGVLRLQRLQAAGIGHDVAAGVERTKLRLRLYRPTAKASEFVPQVADENFELSERGAVMPIAV